MEEIARAARAAYEDYSDDERRRLGRWFTSMDANGDGKVSLEEFMEYSDEHTRSFFNLLDRNGDGFLQFEELLALSYIRASGRPFCAACKGFIPGLFFTCTRCRFANSTEANTYNLCTTCYQGRRFHHQHTVFEDNYTLLLTLQSRQSPSRSGGGRRERLKETMMKSFRRIGKVVSGAAALAGISLSLNSIIPTDA